jgi:dipeptidase
MCDTMVAVQDHTADGAVWFAKNSDREPGEAQTVERHPRIAHKGSKKLQCTYLEIPQASQTNEVLLSRPFWMWGAEIGANEHGVVIGNEAVWTKLPIEKSGLTGMDLLRLALERTSTARDALELITAFLQTYGQGGNCGYRNKNFRYHNSFIIADPNEAWVLETAAQFWAAEKVRGLRTISNVLSIGKEFDFISDGAYTFARNQGWCTSAQEFDFAGSFGDTKYNALSGGHLRSRCTLRALRKGAGKLTLDDFLAVLRNHNGKRPEDGWRMKMPCAHSSWWPTRAAGQTTGSMISRLHPLKQTHYLTGTSAPCLSVFKPIVLGDEFYSTGETPGAGYDDESLFWRHERLHRLVLNHYEVLKSTFNDARMAMEASFLSSTDASITSTLCQESWERHRQILPEWIRAVEKDSAIQPRFSLFNRYWSKQGALDQMPETH